MTEPVTKVPLKGIRGMIARTLSGAWQAPRVAQGLEVDMTAVQALIAQQREMSGKKVTITHVLARAVVSSLTDHPVMNGTVTDAGIELRSEVKLGVAVNTDYGLVVPVMSGIDAMSYADLVDELRGMAEGARAGTLPASAYQGGTFTISTLGFTGIDWFTPVLNPPQIAILGVGRMVDRVVAIGGEAVVRPMMTLTLVFDHRAVDGVPAGLFLADLARRLEAGEPG